MLIDGELGALEAHLYKVLDFDQVRERLALFCHSVQAREEARQLEAMTETWKIEEALDYTAAAEALILKRGEAPLSGLHDLRPLLGRLQLEADLNAGELLRLASNLQAVKRLQAYPGEAEEGQPQTCLERDISLLQALPALAGRIERSIASEEELRDQASPALAQLRRKMRGLQEEIRQDLERLLRSRAQALQEQIITERQGRYVLPVKAEHRGQIQGVVHDVSSSGATLFIEPLAAVQANNKLRELRLKEAEEVRRILHDISLAAAEQLDLLRENQRLLRGIDFAFAKGAYAIWLRAFRPRLNLEGRIHLKRARHPLIERQRVVPIDIRLGTDFDCLVITGPNTGGKTVSLKTLGLLTLMAQCGLFVPAEEESELAIFEDILADIGDEQSIEQSLSTFSAHMKQIVKITERVGPRSLVLLDELGSGTDPTEGAALAIALLDHFRLRGARVLATTHYRELKAYALETPGVENACCEFDTESLRPTYRLLIGVPGVSNAFVISRRLGLDGRIIAEASGLLDQQGRKFEELIQDLEREKSEAQKEREEAGRMRRNWEASNRELEELKERLRQKEAGALEQSRERLREEIGDQVYLVESYLEEIRQKMEQGNYGQAERQAEDLRRGLRKQQRDIEGAIGRATLSRPAARPLQREDIQAGASYHIPHLQIEARALSAADNKGQVLLQSGSMRLKLHYSSLQRPGQEASPSAEKKKTSSAERAFEQAASRRRQRRLQTEKRQNFGSELKLLGQTADEALAKLDRFLDDAVLAGCTQVRIVHGKGTGVLRKAVQDQLKRDRRVRSYRQAAYGEGDSGVTLAELR